MSSTKTNSQGTENANNQPPVQLPQRLPMSQHTLPQPKQSPESLTRCLAKMRSEYDQAVRALSLLALHSNDDNGRQALSAQLWSFHQTAVDMLRFVESPSAWQASYSSNSNGAQGAQVGTTTTATTTTTSEENAQIQAHRRAMWTALIPQSPVLPYPLLDRSITGNAAQLINHFKAMVNRKVEQVRQQQKERNGGDGGGGGKTVEEAVLWVAEERFDNAVRSLVDTLTEGLGRLMPPAKRALADAFYADYLRGIARGPDSTLPPLDFFTDALD